MWKPNSFLNIKNKNKRDCVRELDKLMQYYFHLIPCYLKSFYSIICQWHLPYISFTPDVVHFVQPTDYRRSLLKHNDQHHCWYHRTLSSHFFFEQNKKNNEAKIINTHTHKHYHITIKIVMWLSSEHVFHSVLHMSKSTRFICLFPSSPVPFASTFQLFLSFHFSLFHYYTAHLHIIQWHLSHRLVRRFGFCFPHVNSEKLKRNIQLAT